MDPNINQLRLPLVLENKEVSALCDKLRAGIRRREANPENNTNAEIARLKEMISVISELFGLGQSESG
ncbi:MAG: hypothetical protein M0Q38_15470 [Bacteroidales bacterium]|jgi:hypothetical protein|nr:hypothetical protein [Bacteroidales bacterium]